MTSTAARPPPAAIGWDHNSRDWATTASVLPPSIRDEQVPPSGSHIPGSHPYPDPRRETPDPPLRRAPQPGADWSHPHW